MWKALPAALWNLSAGWRDEHSSVAARSATRAWLVLLGLSLLLAVAALIPGVEYGARK